jgi:predicted transposase YbfD/YdcC
VDFPHVRTLVAVERQRQQTKNGKIEEETAFYLSTKELDEYTLEQYHELIRGHWGGVENRNHWRRDAVLEEDKTRTRDNNICSVFALLRNAYLAILARFEIPLNLSVVKQLCAHKPQVALDMLLNDKLPKLLQSK